MTRRRFPPRLLTPDLARSGITFNSIAPGRVIFEGSECDQFRRKDPLAYAQSMERLPLGRSGTAEEVAAVVVFTCSKTAGLLNGACISVNGEENYSF
jgi:3-oxoacyl-[acyl-carrier protein] reductase